MKSLNCFCFLLISLFLIIVEEGWAFIGPLGQCNTADYLQN